MTGKKIDVKLCEEILNQIPPKLSGSSELAKVMQKIQIQYGININLKYANYIFNSNSNSYYYYSLEQKYIMYLYFKNSELKYAEIKNKESKRKICENGDR